MTWIRQAAVEFALLGLLVILYVVGLTRLEISSQSEFAMLYDVVRTVYTPETYPQAISLMGMLISTSVSAFGYSLWAARMPVLFVSLLCLPAFYLTAFTVWKGRLSALGATVVFGGCLGLLQAATQATSLPLNMLWILLFIWTSSEWVVLAEKRKVPVYEQARYSLQFGLLTGLILVTGGFIHLLYALLVGLAYVVNNREVRLTKTLSWRWLAVGFIAVCVVWFLWVGIFFRGWSVLGPSLVYVPGAHIDVWGLLLGLFWLLGPFWLFVAGVGIEAWRISMGRVMSSLSVSAWSFVVSWFLITVLFVLLAGLNTRLCLAPLALAVGIGLERAMESDEPPAGYSWIFLFNTFLMLYVAVGITQFFFQPLAEVRPLETWYPHLMTHVDTAKAAGAAAASSGKLAKLLGTVQLPLWKLTMIPVPVVMLLGAIATHLVLLVRRQRQVVPVFVLTWFIFWFLLNLLVFPKLANPLDKITPLLISSAQPLHKDIWLDATPLSNQLSLPTVGVNRVAVTLTAKYPHWVIHQEVGGQALSKFMSLPTHKPLVGLLTEKTYYGLDDSIRSQLRVSAFTWTWRPFGLRSLYRLIRPNAMEYLTERVLVVESLPPDSLLEGDLTPPEEEKPKRRRRHRG